MEILTFSQAAEYFGVSLASISRWVKQGKLEQGGKAGKNKTVTQRSVEALSSDRAFQIGLQRQKEKQAKIVKLSERSEIEGASRLEQMENTIARMCQRLEEWEERVERYMEETQAQIKSLREMAQNKEKKSKEKKSKANNKSNQKSK